MNKNWSMKKLSMSLIAGSVCFMQFLPVKASDEYEDQTTRDIPVSDGESYEYTSIDANGNINVIKLPEVDESVIEEEKLDQADSFDVVVKMGNDEQVIATYDDREEAEMMVLKRSMMRTTGSAELRANVDYSKIKYGVVDFHTKPSTTNTNYIETQTNANGYLNGSYAADGAFLGYCSTDQSKIKFRQAGVEGCVSANEVIVRNYDDVKSVNFYRVENNIIYHYITTNVTTSSYANTLNFGPKQSYMKNNTIYYSYDGHYFYTTYQNMIDDYKNNTYKNSINPNQPYYNYFQYLSHRSKTNITASQLNAYVKKMTAGDSKMLDLGEAFISNQNTYGANALLMFAVAANESYWGTSSIALEKNNIFGHNATDYNPGENANKYASPKDSVEHHAKNFISDGYLDPKDYSGRYRGGHLGDKASGMNVKYASDSYWGEKAAAIANLVDQANGNKDYGAYKIGIVAKMTNLQVRKDATASSTSLYSTGNWATFPVLILGQTTGTSVDGNNVWYKIQSDPTLNGDRTSTTQSTYIYDFNNMYGYVAGAYADVVEYTNVDNGIPDDGGNVTFIKGDVNGDGKITPSDYVRVKNHIMRFSILEGESLKAADVNGDGKITPSDYVRIKNIIMGK